MTFEGPESEADHVEGERFGQWRRGVYSGKRAHGGEPESVDPSAGGPDTANEVGEEHAGGEFEGDLEPGNGVVVVYTEDAKAGSKEEWVAGQADECGMGYAAAVGERKLTAQQNILCYVCIDERVTADLRKGGHHPETQQEAAEQGKGKPPEETAGPAYTGSTRCSGFASGLTRFFGFHRIRV